MCDSRGLLRFASHLIGFAFLITVLGGVFFTPTLVHAQKDYDDWKKEQQDEYNEYLNEQDKAFLKFLEKKWKDVEVQTQKEPSLNQVPKEIPTVGDAGSQVAETSRGQRSETETTVTNREKKSRDQTPSADRSQRSSNPQPDKEIEEKENPSPSAEADESTPVESESASGSTESSSAEGMSRMSVRFFGTQAAIPYSKSLAPTLDGAPGEESIRNFWKSMAEQKYSPTLDAVKQRREELGLSDWGYYVYVREFGNELYRNKGISEGSNAATLWTWFMMMKSGYSVRVGFRGDNIFLLLPIQEKIFNRSQIYLNDQKYYIMVEESAGGSLRTYEGQHETADQVLSIDERRLPDLGGATKSRTASFSYDDERFEIEYDYSVAALDYLKTYPNLSFKVLFSSGFSSAAETSLRESIEPHIKDRSPREKVNFLLRFVQFASEYKKPKNLRDEWYTFPEGALAASSTICGGRAVLFSALVRMFLDRPLVGLEWKSPNHLATAVKSGNGLEETSDDRTLTVDGETYIVADPTYIGSSLGARAPWVDQEPKVITFAQN